MSVIHTSGVQKIYHTGKEDFAALKDAAISVQQGEFVSILGKSGSGKTTLFNIISGIDPDYTGTCEVFGIDLSSIDEKERLKMRRERIGIIYQSLNLISTLTVLENIVLARDVQNRPWKEEEADAILRQLGLEEKKHSFIDELSGGEKQRVTIARVLLADPDLILADEPTGALDSVNAAAVFDLLEQLHQKGKTVLVITHDQDLASRAQRSIHLKDGRIVDHE